MVMMLPSKGNLFSKDALFPRSVDPTLMTQILEVGGYFFTLEPAAKDENVTLFVPKGWHHWVLGKSESHLIFGASRF